MSGIGDLINGAVSRETIERWKANAAREMRAFARRARPFDGIRASNYYFYIDTKALTYGLILRGVRPNAAAARGFSAPVGKYRSVPKYRASTVYGWKTLDRARETSPRAGVETLETEYFGVSAQPSQFFGLRRSGKKIAFGLADGVAVPVYSETGFVEWITREQADELARIMAQAGFAALENRR